MIESAVHFEILRLINAPGFQTDVRWISAQSGFSTDEVNMALTRLLRLRMIGLETKAWKDLTGLKQLTRENVRSLALKRIREAAAGDGIKLGRKPKQ